MDPDQNSRQWDIIIDGEEIEKLRRKKISEVTEEEWVRIRDTAARMLVNCPDPGGENESTTGLALGKIQSGKTLSYTTLIALAVDNGYRISVVLAGTKNTLLEQNFTRLCRDLEVTSMLNITPFKNPNPQDEEVINYVLQSGGHVLIVVLKHQTRINRVRHILSSPELREYPTIIIDDEGDEASLNTQFRRGNVSTIYNSILNLRRSLLKYSYIAYTATPQANLLIPGIDALSPDYGVLIQPGDNYCGGSVFFGDDRDRYVRAVNADESEVNRETGIPEGLKRAIATFIVGGVLRHFLKTRVLHSMLIHNSNLTADHVWLEGSVRSLIALWKDILTLPENDPSHQTLLELFLSAYTDLITTVDNPPTWEQVKQKLSSEILVEVWMVNSLPLGKDIVGTPFRLPNNIIVGGNMLGRGVTIPGLAVTYITRRAIKDTNADTMEQRARWFGYKQEYLDICRIFLTSRLINDYTELLRHEDDFWEAISRNERQGLSIRDWPRLFSLDTRLRLRPTRSSIANFKQFRGHGWEIQRKIIVGPDIADENLSLIREFFRTNQGETQLFANTEHTIIRDCPTDILISDLLSQIDTEGTDWENSYISEYLTRLWMRGTLLTIDVLLMSTGNARIRALARDSNNVEISNQINNPMQGRTDGKRPEERDYYAGDEYLHEGRPQLQVHIIQPRESTLNTSVFALYIPNKPEYNLGYVVRDE